MQNIKYFNSAWNDIKHSPGWFGKMCLLGLISFIPIFGFMVVNGYLYGWAREIAWGVHEPMPSKIFGNEDGKLYRRGFYLLIFSLLLALAVGIIMALIVMIPGLKVDQMYTLSGGVSMTVPQYSVIYYVLYFAVLIVEMFILWVGSMRISIYDRLSSGFQLGKIWSMYKYESAGLWRILGMQLLVGLVIGIVLSIVFTIFATFVALGAVGSMAPALSSASSLDYSDALQMLGVYIAAFGPAFLIMLLAFMYVFAVAGMFLSMLLARALGYWTMQFDVPRWRGQDDPMPHERTVA